MVHDRREFQRLKLAQPILAMMGSSNALILDIGITGALVEHYGAVQPGDRFPLKFRWKSADVELAAEVVRSQIVRQYDDERKNVVSHSGMHFVAATGDSAARLEDLIATSVARILGAHRSNAAGDGQTDASAHVLSSIGAARRKRTFGYISYRLRGTNWWRIPTDSPHQPEDGFTVPAWEDEHELETLCRTYEQADAEGRRLIRLVAELSVR